MDCVNKKFTLDDGKNYLVIEQVNYGDNIYLYMANLENEMDTRFVEIKDDSVIPIEPSLFDKEIFPLFLEKFKK